MKYDLLWPLPLRLLACWCVSCVGCRLLEVDGCLTIENHPTRMQWRHDGGTNYAWTGSRQIVARSSTLEYLTFVSVWKQM